MIVVDTGPLVAAAIANDRDHDRCVELFNLARRQRRPLIVPAFVATETCYTLEREGGTSALAAFLRSFNPGGQFILEALLPEDLERMAELVVDYDYLPLGPADASVVAVAERLRVADLATVDTRHFPLVDPRHVTAFTLLPC